MLAPLFIFEAFNFLWNIPFSPFGAEARIYAAYDFALMMFAILQAKATWAQRGGE